MTPDEIKKLDPRELDAIVAEKVMGWGQSKIRIFRKLETAWHDREGHHGHIPKFSTSISDAFSVVEEMGKRGFWLDLKTPFNPGARYIAEFQKHGYVGTGLKPSASDKSAPKAIVLAALAAIQTEDDTPLPLPPEAAR